MSQKHVLLVDDDSDIREVATLSLEMVGGWRVSSAAGGADGLAMARTERPDVILLDVMMPDLDGPGTLRGLQTDGLTRDIPVIFLTAKAGSADHRRFAALGVAGTIVKPFDPMALADQVVAILGAHESAS